MSVITSSPGSGSTNLFQELALELLQEMLVHLDDPVLVLDLLVQGLLEILDCRGNLQFLLAEIVLTLALQLLLQRRDYSLRLLHLLVDPVVLVLKSYELQLQVLRDLQPLVFLCVQLCLYPFDVGLELLMHGPERHDQLLDDLQHLLYRGIGSPFSVLLPLLVSLYLLHL